MSEQFVPQNKRSKTPRSQRDRLLTTAIVTCTYCRRRIAAEEARIDHFIPQVRGGSNRITNKVVACGWCDERKGLLTGHEFNKLIAEVGFEDFGGLSNKSRQHIASRAKKMNVAIHTKLRAEQEKLKDALDTPLKA